MTTIALEKPRIRVPARSALLASAAMPTIQFRGIGAAGAKKPVADDEDMEDDATAAETDPPEDTPPAKKKKATVKKARGDDSTDSGDDEDNDPDGDGDDDDNDDESDRREARGNSPARAARLSERGRIAAILESPAAAANLEFAINVALTTDLSRKQAIALLKSAPKPAARTVGLADRMEQYAGQRPGPGGAAKPGGQAAIDALWDNQAVANGYLPRRS